MAAIKSTSIMSDCLFLNEPMLLQKGMPKTISFLIEVMMLQKDMSKTVSFLIEERTRQQVKIKVRKLNLQEHVCKVLSIVRCGDNIIGDANICDCLWSIWILSRCFSKWDAFSLVVGRIPIILQVRDRVEFSLRGCSSITEPEAGALRNGYLICQHHGRGVPKASNVPIQSERHTSTKKTDSPFKVSMGYCTT